MQFLIKAWHERARLKAARQIIGASSLFDASWYRERYPDIGAAGIDPLDHFIRTGGAEGRNPSPYFNSQWYFDQYSDIRAAGLNPLLHYLEHGRDEGRRIKSLPEAGPADETDRPTKPDWSENDTSFYEVTPVASDLDTEWHLRMHDLKTLLSSGLKGRRWRRRSQLKGRAGKPAIAIGTEVLGIHDPNTSSQVTARLALFIALRAELPVSERGLRLSDDMDPWVPVAFDAHRQLISAGLGLSLLADCWFVTENRLCIRLDGNVTAGVLRAYQFSLKGQLRCCAEVPLDGTGIDIAEVRLEHQLLALLLTLTSDDGLLRDTAVLPFPSLLRGGLHYSELAAIETAPGPHSALADYAHSLALELFGWPEGPNSFSIGELTVDLRGATGAEFIFRPDLVAALGCQYAIGVVPLAGIEGRVMAELVERLKPAHIQAAAERAATGTALTLPADALPSLYSLVSRRAEGRWTISSFCVADAATLLPKALVCMPITSPNLARLQHPALPAQLPLLTPAGREDAAPVVPASALAVRFHNPLSCQFDALMPVPTDQHLTLPLPGDIHASSGALVTAIVDRTRQDGDVEQLIASIAGQTLADRIELVLAGGRRPGHIETKGLASIEHLDLKGFSSGACLNTAAAHATTPYLLLLDPRVVLADARIIETLIAMAAQPGAGSAACALATECGDETGIRVHSAGYFPTHMALWSDPVFTLDQLDVAAALPAATYPVVANHMKCSVVPTHRWRELGGLDADRFPVSHFDLDFGYRLLTAGFTNHCTTLVRAEIDMAEPNADFPDPLAHRLIRPAQWQAIFDRVTTIRELRR